MCKKKFNPSNHHNLTVPQSLQMHAQKKIVINRILNKLRQFAFFIRGGGGMEGVGGVGGVGGRPTQIWKQNKQNPNTQNANLYIAYYSKI